MCCLDAFKFINTRYFKHNMFLFKPRLFANFWRFLWKEKNTNFISSL